MALITLRTPLPPWALTLALWLVFLPGPVRMSARDNIPAQLLTESLISGHGFDLASYYPTPLPSDFREVRWNGPRLVSKFSVAHAVASVPVALGIRAVEPELDPLERSRLTGRAAGALFTAVALGVTYAALLRLTAPAPALAIAVGAAFASPLYSVASRELWNHGPAALLLSMIGWLSWRRGRGAIAAGAACVAGLYFVRHAALLPGAVLFLGLHRTTIAGPGRRAFLRASLVGLAASGLPLALLNLAVAGNPVGSYAPFQMFEYGWGVPSAEAVLAYLISPGRGLFIFAPVTFLAVLGLRRAAAQTHAKVAWACAAALMTALLEIASYGPWWGGFGFGPRMLTEYVPLLALMAASAPPRAVVLVCALCVPVAGIHAGSLFRGGHSWDERREIDSNPSAVWDLRDSPFSDVLLGRPRPDPANFDPARLTLPTGLHHVRAGAVAPWLAFGWEAPESEGVWAEGEETWLAFRLPSPGRHELSFSAAAPVVDGRPQRLEISFGPGDGQRSVHTFRSGLWDYETVRVEAPLQEGVIVARIKSSHIWFPGHGDTRRCTFYVRWIRLERLDGGLD